MTRLASLSPRLAEPILTALKRPKTLEQIMRAAKIPKDVARPRVARLVKAGYVTCDGTMYRAVPGAPRVSATEDQLDTLLAVLDGFDAPKDLAEDLGIGPNTASTRMLSACRAGLIRRTASSNARQTWYEPTEDGLALAAWVSR